MSARLDAWGGPALAVLAAALGLAAAQADGVSLDVFKGALALVLAAPAYLGFTRTLARVGGDRFAPLFDLSFAVVLPALFVLLLVAGSDHLVRGAWSFTAFAVGLPLALLAACVPLARGFAQRADDLEAGRDSLAAAIAPINAKLWLFGCAMPAYLWLIVQVGRDALPQACAAAALTVVVSLRAVRVLYEDFDDADEMARAVRLTTIAALTHGALLIAGLLLADHFPVF
jgi:1,4-dihydroxy-2-naphthoate octaprenyltransferase